jgi:FAD/FMN-containing dehydrogenase
MDTLNLDSLRATTRGTIVTPTDAAFESYRRIWNGMIDRRPALIVRCAGAGDVIAAVKTARDAGLAIAVCGGGHSFPGYSTCDGGVMIDLRSMKGIRVDPVARRARAEAGNTWSDYDRETQAFGLASTGGMISHTGIAGLTLGGGFGWLMRKHGLAVDNLVSVDVVTANGELVHASADENADLFWALRGGGGNFGVVTSFEYNVHPVGPMVYGGLVAFPLPEAPHVLARVQELMATASDDLSTCSVMITTPEGHKAVGVGVCFIGDLSRAEDAVAPFRKISTPVMEQLGPMPYTVVQTMFDGAATPGNRYYLRSNYVNDMSEDFVSTLAEGYAKAPSPMSAVVIPYMRGAVARVPADATAYYHRSAAFTFTVLGGWVDAADDSANVTWLKELWGRLTPYLPDAVYVNELSEEGTDRVRSAYGPSYGRLSAVKKKYDPTNLFCLNQNIAPA